MTMNKNKTEFRKGSDPSTWLLMIETMMFCRLKDKSTLFQPLTTHILGFKVHLQGYPCPLGKLLHRSSSGLCLSRVKHMHKWMSRKCYKLRFLQWSVTYLELVGFLCHNRESLTRQPWEVNNKVRRSRVGHNLQTTHIFQLLLCLQIRGYLESRHSLGNQAQTNMPEYQTDLLKKWTDLLTSQGSFINDLKDLLIYFLVNKQQNDKIALAFLVLTVLTRFSPNTLNT